jgi:hypothetical protein
VSAGTAVPQLVEGTDQKEIQGTHREEIAVLSVEVKTDFGSFSVGSVGAAIEQLQVVQDVGS